MKKQILLPVILIAVSAVLAAVSLFVLPETAVIQFSFGSGANTTAPRAVAVLIPSALGIGGAAMSFLTKGDKRARRKCLIVSAVGILVFIILIAVNAAVA